MSGRVIVITSGKGGVGKTTTNANIGTALARAGKKVVMIDTDLGLRNLDLLLGLENRIVYTIVDVVEERCKLKQALVKDKKNPNLCLLAAAQTRDKTAVTEEQLKDICEKLKKDFDFILVDCPAGIEQGFQNAVAGASEAIVVTTPEMSAVRDADRIIGLLEAKEEIKSYKLLLRYACRAVHPGHRVRLDGLCVHLCLPAGSWLGWHPVRLGLGPGKGGKCGFPWTAQAGRAMVLSALQICVLRLDHCSTALGHCLWRDRINIKKRGKFASLFLLVCQPQRGCRL